MKPPSSGDPAASSAPRDTSAFLAPRLTLRVAVTGHRPNNLAGNDLNRLADRVEGVLARLRGVVEHLHEESGRSPGRHYAESAPVFRLTTALAEGADQLVARAAIEQGYELNVIMPLPREHYEADFTGQALTGFRELCAHEAVGTCTELDLGEELDRPQAYLTAGRLTLAHSDLLVAIWNGQPAAGIGGTAQIVHEAIQRGLTTVVITLEGEVKLWIGDPTTEKLSASHGWQTLEALDTASTTVCPLSARLHETFALIPAAAAQTEEQDDSSAPSPAQRLDRFARDHLRAGSFSFGYELLRKIFMPHRRFRFWVDYRLEQEREGAWSETLAHAEATGGATFRELIDQRLRERWLRADNLAIHYANRFRSAFVANFTLAAAAVAVGLLVLFNMDSLQFKAYAVTIELLLLGTILGTTIWAHRQQWHERWIDYRSLAEALRPARLPMLIGGAGTRSDTGVGGSSGEDWVAWYLRAAIREIPPPTGVIDPTVLRQAIRVACSEEIEGQLSYHRGNQKSLHVLDHRLERAAETTLFLAILSGAFFLAVYLWPGAESVVKAYKPLATFLGGVLPVIGAAIFGIRATADFRTAIGQSERMVRELDSLGTQLGVALAHLDRARVVQLLGKLSRTLSDDLQLWNMVYSERELAPGF